MRGKKKKKLIYIRIKEKGINNNKIVFLLFQISDKIYPYPVLKNILSNFYFS